MRCHQAVFFTLPAALGAQGAQSDTTTGATFGGFVDGYYAWDLGRPASFDRSFAGGTTFTTQPARHNEFNIDLAFIEAKLDAPAVRGRVALQAGTAVQSNYAGEPANGAVRGRRSPATFRKRTPACDSATPSGWMDLTPTSTTTLRYYNFFTDEAGNRLRAFDGVGAKVASVRLALLGQVDLGTQGKPWRMASRMWYGFTARARPGDAHRRCLGAGGALRG